MTDDSGLKEAVALAMKMETDAIALYGRAARTVRSQAGRLMFESLSRDEENHLRVVREILRETLHRDPARLFPGTPVSRVRTVFEENRALLEERIAADPGDAEALELALRMEEAGVKLYRGAAQKSGDPLRRRIFERLEAEERQHHLLLQNAQSFLNDTGNWFIWEEHGILDGG